MAGKIAMTKVVEPVEVPPVASGDPWLDQEAARQAKVPAAMARLKESFPEEQTKLGEIQPDGFRGTIVEWNHVCDRLDEADPAWDHRINVSYIGPIGDKIIVQVTCTLRVLGIERMGHSAGTATSGTVGNVAKSVETDALKRAATKFGVARYLYAGESRPTPSFTLTEEQRAAVMGNAPGGAENEWASGLLGRKVNLDVDSVTAAELDILIAAGGK